MKIALFERSDFDKFPGGDTVQIEAIANYLTQLGVEVFRVQNLFADLEGIDFAFVFNLTRPWDAYHQALCAKNQSVPFIFFPIYWNLEKAIPEYSFNISLPKRFIKKLVPGSVRSLLRGIEFLIKNKDQIWGNGSSLVEITRSLSKNKIQSCSLQWAKFICPNSIAEREHLLQEFPKLSSSSIQTIYNGINTKELPDANFSDEAREPCVVCVGGIGPRKNQLALIRAAQHVKCRFIIVGQPSIGAGAYAKQVFKEAPNNVEFEGQLDRPNIFRVLRKSLVHCQPSFIETPGLASMEAAALGCNLVVSDVGPTREYFGDNAFFVDPHNLDNLVSMIQKALNKPPSDDETMLAFRKKYDWARVLQPLNSFLNLQSQKAIE